MHISERSYWIILIVSFVGFCLVLGLWLIPQNLIEYNLGIGLLTSSVFMVLTIIFLSWLLDVRKRAEWDTVKNRVLARFSKHLLNLSDIITFYFLGSKKDIELEEKLKTMRQSHFSEEQEKLENKMTMEYYSRNPVKLGELGNLFFDSFRKESILEIKQLLKDQKDYFEHVLTEYLTFLSPELSERIMSLQDCIDSMMSACDEARILAGIRKKDMPPEHQVNEAKNMFIKATEKIAKEIDYLNKAGLGF